MSLQSCVNRLFKLNSNYLYADQAFNQASSLQTLSDDLYSDPLRFLYELVQNADDASSTRLQFALIEGNYLIVAHNGRIFSEEDVRSLCSINKSTKIQDAQTVGYKGLGFKAIFGKSDYALVITNNEAFRFDATHEFEWTWTDINRKKWERDNKRKFIYPWQICPIWTEHHEIPAPVLSWICINRLSVNIIIRLLNIEETQNAFRQLADQPHTFLFLRHIRELKFSESLKSSSICIKNEPNEIIRLLYNAKQHSQWLVCRRQVLVPPEKLEDIRLPKKLRSVQSTEIILAAKISTQNEKKFIPVSNDDNILFAYIPTKISTYKLPILVNTNFLTNANREQIHTDSTWNQWLFERIPHETIEWMKDIIMKREWGSKGYELLPTAAMGNDILTKIYNDNRSHALSDAKFICNTHGEYLTVREAIIDLTGLSNQPFVGTAFIRQYIIHNYNDSRISLPTNPFVSDNPYLRELGVRIFDWTYAIKMFGTRTFQENFSPDRDMKLISYLFTHRSDETLSQLIHIIPFIMDRNKYLRSPTHIYFPSEFDDVSWHSSDCSDDYVHQDVMNQLQRSHRQWLEELGVKIKTDLTFFHRTIVPNAATFIHPNNAESTIRRLFNLFINGETNVEHLRSVERLSLLTTTNKLIPANRLYLSAPYEPHLSLDSVLPSTLDLFVSPVYLQQNLLGEWKLFFCKLGVQENITFVKLNEDNRSFFTYNKDQRRIIFGLNSQQVHDYKYRETLTFLEYTENTYEFARFFWSYVIKTIDIRRLNRSESALWGSRHKRGAIEGSEVNSFPQWFVRTRSCIPVSILLANGQCQNVCYLASKVFTGRLKYLIGRYLPIFDCIDNLALLTDEWETFFRFQTELSIDDHLLLLKQIYIQNQKGIEYEDDIRIQNIYDSLSHKLCGIDQNQCESYREKCRAMNVCLLSTTKHFMPPEELSFWSISNLSVPTELYIIKIDGKSRQHHYLSVLLYVLNVDKIDIDNLNFIPINASLCDEIANRLQKSYFLQLLKFHKINETDQIHRLDDIKFFEAERLEFYMNNANIFVGTTQVHVKSNCFYIVRPWNTEHVLAQLSEKICIFFQLPMVSFKNHVEKLLIIESADSYFIQLGIPLVIEEIVNNAMENRIKQTNLDLFNKLPSATPAELLLVGLKAQNSSWTGYIYHYTHLENAISIVCQRSIKSRYQLTQLGNFKDSSSYDFMSHVHDEVNRYVRFYFRPRTLTQYHNENLGSGKCKKRNEYTPICPVPIFLRIDLQAILNIPNIQWKVSLGDMSRTQTIYDSTRDVIEQFDFDGVFKNDDAELNEYSIQLEFLIENELNFQLLPNDCIHLICQNRDAKTSLECVLKEQLMDTYSLQIDKNYFFEKNDRIFINHEQNQDHISVRMNSGNECPARGMFIVQINCSHQQETMELACKGNKICAAFYHDQLTTIYGREKSIDVLVGKQNYAVYYQYEGRIWLIYTNHCQYEFDKLHTEKYVEFALYD